MDVYFDDIKMNIDGGNFSHREVFFYDNQLFLPIEDLANKFNLVLRENKDNLSFASNGSLLNFSGDNIHNTNYQTGYEILAKNKIIEDIQREIDKSKKDKSPTFTQKTIPVVSGMYKIYADGRYIGDYRLIKYNNARYMSAMDLSPVLYITPSLKGNSLSIDGNNILNKKPGFSNSTELAKFRLDLNNRLNEQLTKMEKKRDIILGKKIPYEDIKSLAEMEKYINKHIDKMGDVPISTRLKANSNSWYYLDISVESRYEYRWINLSRRDIEASVWDMYVAISSLYDENASIQGHVSGSNSRYRNYVEFNTNNKNIYFHFIDSRLNLRDKLDPIFLEDSLNKNLDSFNREYFQYKVKISGYDVEVEVKPDNHRPMEWPFDRKLSLINAIKDEILYYYPQVNIFGNMGYPGYDDIHFTVEDGLVSSANIRDEMVAYLNRNYSSFTSEDLRADVKYEIFEESPRDYKVHMYLDFDINDVDWNNKKQEDLRLFMNQIVGEMISLWDVNVYINAFDKNHHLLREDIISQDVVQAIYSDPVGANIEEGKFISLFSNTERADIYYTLDGSLPNKSNSIRYTGPIQASIVDGKNEIRIRAYGIKEGLRDSPTSDFVFKIIKNENMAAGLSGLSIVGEEKLKPEFKTDEYNYNIEYQQGTDEIKLKASAKSGKILIDNVEVASGEDHIIPTSRSEVQIVHREENKVDRIYKLKLVESKPGQVEYDFKIDKFNTVLTGYLKGQFMGVPDFTGYSVELVYLFDDDTFKVISLNKNGDYEIEGFKLGLHSIFGYELILKDPSGAKVYNTIVK